MLDFLNLEKRNSNNIPRANNKKASSELDLSSSETSSSNTFSVSVLFWAKWQLNEIKQTKNK